jgi:hypothetical protein
MMVEDLEQKLGHEQAKAAAMHAQLQELRHLTISQAETMDALKNECAEARAAYDREIERIEMLHKMEVETLKKKHHDLLHGAMLDNRRSLAHRRAVAQVCHYVC